MAGRLRQLFIGQLTTDATVLYSPLSDEDFTVMGRIQDGSVLNVSAADVTLSLWVPSGGAAGAQNMILKEWTVPAWTAANGGRADVPSLRGRVIGSGGSLVAKASVAGALTLAADGMEFLTAVASS
jgi:hypothetical protein